MKKNLATLALLFFISIFSFAGNADLFQYEKEMVKQNFEQLNQLENFINQNEGVTINYLKFSNNPLVNNVSSNLSYASIFMGGPLGIPSWLWGCVLGPIGIVIVAVTDESRHEVTSAIIGCVIGSLIWGGGWYFGWTPWYHR